MNENKTKWSLLDFGFLADVVEVMREGAERPGREVNQWKTLPKTREQERAYFDACMRHLVAASEALDKDQARVHLAAVAANAMIMHHLTDWRNNVTETNVDSAADYDTGPSDFEWPWKVYPAGIGAPDLQVAHESGTEKPKTPRTSSESD